MANIINKGYFYGDLAVPQVDDTAVGNLVAYFIKQYEPKLLTNLLGYSLYKDFIADIYALVPVPGGESLSSITYEYVVGRGQSTDPSVNTSILRDARLKNKIYEIEIRGLGPVSVDEFTDRSDLIGGFDMIDGTSWEDGMRIFVKIVGVQSGYSDNSGLLCSDVSCNQQKYIDLLLGKEYTNRNGELTKWRGLTYCSGTYRASLIANYVYYWYIRNQASNSSPSGEKETKTENAESVSPRYKMARAWNEMSEWNLELREFLLSNSATYPEYVDPLSIRCSSAINDRQELLMKISPYL